MNTIDNQRLQQIANAANALFPTLVSEPISDNADGDGWCEPAPPRQ